MDGEANMHDLERMLHDASLEPTHLPLSLLKVITNNFSDLQQIGRGGFAVVYKGLLQNGLVAVKKLSQTHEVDEKMFNQEVDSMMRVKHENIVRFLGYCADTQGKVYKYEGKNVMAEERERLLCFEFMPNGSLDKYVSDATDGLDWRTRYNIIKGICEGLYYLHENNIVHLDLKPANILLNNCMLPKIADFGISRCFDETQSRATTSKLYGTLGYMAPEFYGRVITYKSDIYSLGIIIIEILTGRKGYPDIDNVMKNWSTRFGNIPAGDPQLEHVKACIEMGIKCIDFNPAKRPTTGDIIGMLVEMEKTYDFNETVLVPHQKNETVLVPPPKNETVLVPLQKNETVLCTSSAADVLDVYPLDISFPLEAINELIKCPVTLTNRTNDLIGVCIKPTFPDNAYSNAVSYVYAWEQPKYGEDDPVSSSLFKRLGPHSSVTIYMIMRRQQSMLQAEKGMFDVVMVATESEENLGSLFTYWEENKSEVPSWGSVEEFGSVVHRATLRASVALYPARRQEAVGHQLMPAASSDGKHAYGTISCMDVHPTKTWLLVGYWSGHVCIWNYESQERIIMFEVTSFEYVKCPGPIHSIKFIAEAWFAAGDRNGFVHVYTNPYNETGKVKEFEAHCDKALSHLAVLPECELLLTASYDDKSIKLWDWSQGWACTRVIDTHANVYDLIINPRGTNTFASRNLFNDVKVWHIHSWDAMATFKGWCPTFCTDSDQHFLATRVYDHPTLSYSAKIWDLQTKKPIHTLYPGIQSWDLKNLAYHPTLPILAGIMTRTGSKPKEHQIVLWDVSTYRVTKRIEILKEDEWSEMAFDGREDITSLLVAFPKEISIIKINVSTLLTSEVIISSTQVISDS